MNTVLFSAILLSSSLSGTPAPNGSRPEKPALTLKQGFLGLFDAQFSDNPNDYPLLDWLDTPGGRAHRGLALDGPQSASEAIDRLRIPLWVVSCVSRGGPRGFDFRFETVLVGTELA